MQLRLFGKASIAIYVRKKYTRSRYGRRKDAFATCGWPGLSMLITELSRNGLDVDRCNMDNVTDYKIILVSIISAIDWYEFVKERMQWTKGNYTVIIGGSGVDNIRPFLEFGDVFVFGRAENLIVPLIDATLQGQRYNHLSVCYTDSFDVTKRYEMAQSNYVYPNNIKLTNSKPWQERSIGCQRRCLFCQYTWTRKHVGGLQSESGVSRGQWKVGKEKTIFELDLDNPQGWPNAGYLTIGIDGMSERLRFMVNKPITNEMIKKLLSGISKKYGNGHIYAIKLYNIIGYPTETIGDWLELRDIIYQSTPQKSTRDTSIPKITLHHTPFKATPITPAATWPVEYTNHRLSIVEKLQHENCKDYKWSMYGGQDLDFNVSFAIEGLPTTALWMITYRGLESDSWLVKEIAQGKSYKGKDKDKAKWFADNVDIDRFFRAYKWSELPTRYLHGHTSYEKMARMSDARLRKYGAENIANLIKS